MKIFIDDERYPTGDDWVIVRNMAEFTNHVIRFGFPNYISFDHDLGDIQPTGYDIAKWIVEYDMDHNVMPDNFQFFVHSQNPIGKANIENLLNSYLNHR